MKTNERGLDHGCDYEEAGVSKEDTGNRVKWKLRTTVINLKLLR